MFEKFGVEDQGDKNVEEQGREEIVIPADITVSEVFARIPSGTHIPIQFADQYQTAIGALNAALERQAGTSGVKDEMVLDDDSREALQKVLVEMDKIDNLMWN